MNPEELGGGHDTAGAPDTTGAGQAVEALLEERYANEEWIYRARAPKKRMGFAEGTTPGGLIQVHLSLSGGVIETVLITGDYFSRTCDVAKLESILKYCRAGREGLQRQLEEVRAADFIHRVDLPVMIELILKAVADAREASRRRESAILAS